MREGSDPSAQGKKWGPSPSHCLPSPPVSLHRPQASRCVQLGGWFRLPPSLPPAPHSPGGKDHLSCSLQPSGCARLKEAALHSSCVFPIFPFVSQTLFLPRGSRASTELQTSQCLEPCRILPLPLPPTNFLWGLWLLVLPKLAYLVPQFSGP